MNVNFPQQPYSSYYSGPARDYNGLHQSYSPQLNRNDASQYPGEAFANLSLNEQNQPRTSTPQIPLGHAIAYRGTGMLGSGNSYSNYSPYANSSLNSLPSNNLLDVLTNDVEIPNSVTKNRNQPAYNSLINSPAEYKKNSSCQHISTLEPGKSYPVATNSMESLPEPQSPKQCKSSLFYSHNGKSKKGQSSVFAIGSTSRCGTVPTKSSLSHYRIPNSEYITQEYDHPTPGLAVNSHLDVMYGQPFGETDQAEIQGTLLKNISIPRQTSIDYLDQMQEP
jgi:hypothetical protein